MPIIKPDGLLNGDRIAALSDTAKFYWPYIYAASNGYGRFKIDYLQIIGTAFRSFRQKPSEEIIASTLREFRNQHLLFIYKARGEVWGAFDSAAGQRYFNGADKKSPAPPEPAFSKWVEAYRETKHNTVSGVSSLGQVLISEHPDKFDVENTSFDRSNDLISAQKTHDLDAEPTQHNTTPSLTPTPFTDTSTQELPTGSPKAANKPALELVQSLQSVFLTWWDIWSKVRGTNHRDEACRAFLSVVKPVNSKALITCTESYLASLENPATGYNPENFLFDQVRDGFAARWPPSRARASPKPSKAANLHARLATLRGAS